MFFACAVEASSSRYLQLNRGQPAWQWHYTFFATSCYKEAGWSSHLTVLGLLQDALSGLGLATEFRSEKKILGIDSEWLPLSTEERVHSKAFRGLRKSRFRGSEQKKMAWKKLVLQKILLQQQKRQHVFVQDMLWNGIPRVCFNFFTMEWNSEYFSPLRKGLEQNFESFLLPRWFRTEFREFASIFVPWYRILSIFLLCGMVRNGILRIFCSAEQPEFHRNKPIVPSFSSSAE